MILVSGTKRSGTSMWMQVLRAAGFSVLGEAFPKNWEKTIKEANPEGFYESPLRTGIYYKTNPDPHTGEYLRAEDTTRHVVKVFAQGVIRTERAYIDYLVANVREWREYEASINQLYATERANIERRARERGKKVRPPPLRLSPPLEWWNDNYSLIRDLLTRQYKAQLWSYDRVLGDPEAVVRVMLEWIGEGDVEAAVAAIKPEHRTITRPKSSSVEPEHAAVFDELYETVHHARSFKPAFIEKLNETHHALAPQFEEFYRKRREHERTRGPRPRPKPW